MKEIEPKELIITYSYCFLLSEFVFLTDYVTSIAKIKEEVKRFEKTITEGEKQLEEEKDKKKKKEIQERLEKEKQKVEKTKDQLKVAENEKNKLIDNLKNQFRNYILPYDEKNGKIDIHIGDEGHPNTIFWHPALFVKIPHLLVHSQWQPMRLKPEKGEECKAKIRMVILVFEAGIGVCYFTIKINKNENPDYPLIKSNIARFLKLGRVFETRENGKTETIAKINEVLWPRGRDEIFIEDNKIPQSLFSIYKKSMDVLSKVLNSAIFDREYIQILDKKYVQPLKDEEEPEFWQEPYATIILGVPEGEMVNFITPEYLLSVLHQWEEDTKLDETHIEKWFHTVEKNGKVVLVNMFIRKDFFIYLGMRITVGIYVYKEEDFKFQPIAESVTHTLIFTIHQLRMKWHANVIANAWLNEEISEIYEEVAAEKMKKPEEGITFFKKLVVFFKHIFKDRIAKKTEELKIKKERIVSLKKLIIQILDDPITYRTSSGSAITIYEQGKKEFHIEELQRVLIDKKSELDKLYDIVQDKINDLQKEKESKLYWKIIGWGMGISIILAIIIGLSKVRIHIPFLKTPIDYLLFIALITVIIATIISILWSKKEGKS